MSDKETQNDSQDAAVDTLEADESAEKAFEFVEAPVFDVEYKGECAYEVKVVIGPANARKQAEHMFEELKEGAELPGFRKGKAPLNLLHKKFGKAVHAEATEKLIEAAFRELIKKEALKPIDFPDVDGVEAAKERKSDEPLEVTLKFEVAPRCELGQYRGLSLERPILEINDAAVEGAIGELRERLAVYETATGKAKEKDQVIINFKGTIDGEEFSGGSAENYAYILGSGRFFKEFEEALTGAKAGETCACTVEFPEDYHGKDVAGKSANFEITVNEIKRKTLPEVTGDFAKESGFEDVAGMRATIREQLQQGSDEQSRRILEQRAIEAVVAGSTFEISKSLIDSSAREYFQQELRRLAQMRISPTELSARMEELEAKSHEDAVRQIKAFVAIGEIRDAEGIEVTDEDFEKEAEAIRTRTGMDMSVVTRFLKQDEQRSEYEGRIARQKAVDVIIDTATITDKKVSQDELDKADDDTEES
ncbi:MAG: trigger factor [Candidatus Hydrogenedentes bacterium]|nr:trigger factor [Candidatus Hydrogenedentota bacterium]